MANIGFNGNKNFKHIILNNNSHDLLEDRKQYREGQFKESFKRT